jgi:hypothetical protein
MQNLLPKIEALPGAVHLQRVKCGKVNCRCASGKPHEAYYRFWRERGKLCKAYVRKADVERVRAACVAWAQSMAEMDSAKAELLSGPDADKVRREIRAMMRSAGATEQIISRIMRKTASNKSQL